MGWRMRTAAYRLVTLLRLMVVAMGRLLGRIALQCEAATVSIGSAQEKNDGERLHFCESCY